MAGNSLTVKELLNPGEKFDPMNIDTSEIKALSNALPQDGNIDTNNAEVMATKYLRGADICAELTAIALAYVQKTSSNMKMEYSQAALVRSEDYFTTKNGGKKPAKITDKMRTLYAEMDEEYLAACQKHDEAMAFAKWVNGKYDSFNKMHYHCKQALSRGYDHERISGWERDITGNQESGECSLSVNKSTDDDDSGW